MSYFMMYLFVMLDTFRSTFNVLAWAALIILFFTILGCVITDDTIKISNLSKIIIKYAAITAIIFITFCTFIPNTKQMAAIYIIPTIANNEDVQEIFGTSMNIVKEQAKQYLEELYEKKE